MFGNLGGLASLFGNNKKSITISMIDNGYIVDYTELQTQSLIAPAEEEEKDEDGRPIYKDASSEPMDALTKLISSMPPQQVPINKTCCFSDKISLFRFLNKIVEDVEAKKK